MTDDNDREHRNWLMHLMDYYGRYHDHKENMAWVATAFYIPSIISAAFASNSLLFEHYKWQTTLCISIAAILALLFVVWQFKKRCVAGQNALNAYKRLRGRCGEQWFIKVDDPPEGWKSALLSCVAIAGATTVSILIIWF